MNSQKEYALKYGVAILKVGEKYGLIANDEVVLSFVVDGIVTKTLKPFVIKKA